MYSSLDDFEEFEEAGFNFNFYHFAIWKNNELVYQGKYDTNISCGIRVINGKETKNVILFRDNLNDEIASIALFDKYLSGNGTDLLLLLPKNKFIQMLSYITGGPTRDNYEFENNQPYSCRIDFENGQASRLTLNLYGENKVIEFY